MDAATIIEHVVTPIIIAIVFGILAELARRYVAWVKQAKIPEIIRSGMLLIGEVAEVCVANEQQTRVVNLKNPSTPGAWTPTEADASRENAMNETKNIAAVPIQMLKDSGVTETQVHSLVSKSVEAAVLKMKNGKSTTVSPSGLPIIESLSER